MIALAACLWGTWSLFFRPAERIQAVAPAVQVLVVFSVIFIATVPGAIRDRPVEPRPPRAWLAIAVLGIGDAFNALLFFWAMQKTSLALAVLSHYLAPVLVALGAPLVLRERLRLGTLGALAVCLTGLFLLLEPWSEAAGAAAVGVALGAGSAVFYAGNVLLTKRVERWFSPRELLAWHVPPALVVVACFVPTAGLALKPVTLAWLAMGGALAGALGGVLFLGGLRRVDASRASVLTLLEPVVAVLIGALVYAEVPSPVGWFGAALVLLGAGWVLLPPSAARVARPAA